MPILVMAVLALILFGTIGILLSVAVIMEHSSAEHPTRRPRLRFKNSAVVPALGPKLNAPHEEPAEHLPSEEKIHEHAFVG